ncbi:MAG: hypothetical protein QNJ08_05010 [Crocosphaera sp.]|nr:hypothetical protein [Crocosphaera sp.]
MKFLDCQTLCALTPIVIAVCGAVIVVTAIIILMSSEYPNFLKVRDE